MTAEGSTSSGPAWASRRATPIDRIDGDLRALWAKAGPGGAAVTRTQTMTVIAVCETPAYFEAAAQAVGIAGTVGARTIVVAADEPQAAASITTEIALHPRDGKTDVPGGESVFLRAHGKARAFIPDTVGKLLTPDVPVYVWWVGDLPDDDSLFDHLAPLAKLTIFDTAEMDLRDLAPLDRLAKGADRFALADFGWQRLRTWQELTARFFDDPRAGDELAALDEIKLTFHPRRDHKRTSDPFSNQVALFAGWLVYALGLRLGEWTSDLSATLLRADGGKVRLVLEPVDRNDVPIGALIAVDLRGKDAHCHVGRDDADALVICWSGERPGMPIPAQCVRIHPPVPGRMLGHVLEHAIADTLFEHSLETAAALVAPVAPAAPRKSERPEEPK